MEPITVPISEACRLLGVGRSKLYGLIKEGQLRPIKLGRRSLLSIKALRALVEGKEAA